MATPNAGLEIDSSSTESRETLPEHSLVGEFEIVGVIGEGGFGTVYLATDHSLRRKVALKEYRPASLVTRQGATIIVRSPRDKQAFEDGLTSFMNEAQTLARFDHPALIRVYRVWRENNTAYMAMPLCEGLPLTRVVKEKQGLISEAWLKSIFAPLLDAVETLHGAQIYHRDIAPDNIIIQDNGAPMLLDFGAARQIAADMTQALTVVLKPGYAPIEQYADDSSMKQGPWTDVYALGAVLYFVLTGKPPPNSVTRLAKDPLQPLARLLPNEGFSQEFLAAIDSALGVRPEDRPQSIGAFRTLLGLDSIVPRTQMYLSPASPTTTSKLDKAASASTRAKTAKPAAAAAEESQATIALPRKTPRTPKTKTPVPPSAAKSTARAAAPVAPAAEAALPAAAPTAAVAAAPIAPPAPPPPAPNRSAAESVSKPVAAAGSRKGLLIAGVAAAVVVLGVGGFLMRNSSQSSPSAAPAAVVAAPGSSSAPPASVREATSPAPAAAPDAASAAAPPPASAAQPSAARDAAPATEPVAAAPSKASAPASSPLTDATKAAGAADAPPVENAPATGTITLTVKPWGTVIVDGVNKGASPPLKKLTLPEGKHKVEVTNPGFPGFTSEVEVKKERSINISHQFK